MIWYLRGTYINYTLFPVDEPMWRDIDINDIPGSKDMVLVYITASGITLNSSSVGIGINQYVYVIEYEYNDNMWVKLITPIQLTSIPGLTWVRGESID